MRKKKIKLQPEKIYHVYNHAISSDLLFRCDENYNFFLKKYIQFINPIADTFAYCLMPNHFHLSIRIKKLEDLYIFFISENKLPKTTVLNDEIIGTIENLVSKQFGNFFNSYSKSYNKMYKRKGKLFLEDFERKLIDTDEYYKTIIHYIHFNPVYHGFVKDMRDWKYSSFESFFRKTQQN